MYLSWQTINRIFIPPDDPHLGLSRSLSLLMVFIWFEKLLKDNFWVVTFLDIKQYS